MTLTPYPSTIGAYFSGPYRYSLYWPTGLERAEAMAFVGANPSKAGQVVNGRVRSDPTVSRMRETARRLGFGYLVVVNCRAWVATDPKDVPPDPEAIGPENDQQIMECIALSDLVVCAWGHLAGKRREAEVLDIIRRAGKVPHALALTQNGTPRHPRGIPLTARPFPMVTR